MLRGFNYLTNEIAAEAENNRAKFAVFTNIVNDSNKRIEDIFENVMYAMSASKAENSKRMKAWEDQLSAIEQEADKSWK